MRYYEIKIIIMIFLLAFGVKSCKTFHTLSETPTLKNRNENTQKILFLTFKAVNNKVDNKIEINLANRVISDGKIKQNTALARKPVSGDFVYTIYGKDSRIILQNYIENPLTNSIEYANQDGKLYLQVSELDSSMFSVRFQIPSDAEILNLEKYNGSDADNVFLYSTNFKKLQ
jgi:hypothetical protein